MNRVLSTLLILFGSIITGFSQICTDTPYVVTKGGVTRLIPCGDPLGASFGHDIQLEDNIIVISAPTGDLGGSVHIYRYTGGWVLEQIIRGSDTDLYDLFGISVSIRNNLILVGASGADGMAPESGAAYLFRFNGSSWVEKTKIVAPDGVTGDDFGIALDLDTAGLAIGAPDRKAPGTSWREGGVYLYSYDAPDINYRAMLRVPHGSRNTWAGFGSQVTVDGNRMSVAAEDKGLACFYEFIDGHWILQLKEKVNRGHIDDIALDGEVGIYTHGYGRRSWYSKVGISSVSGGSWNNETYLSPFDGGNQDGGYGESVAIENNQAAIGRPNSNHFKRDDIGGVYWMKKEAGTWYQRFKYVPVNWPDVFKLGNTVAIKGNKIFASSLESQGAVYIIDLDHPDLCLPPYKNFDFILAPGKAKLRWNPMPDADEYLSAVYEAYSYGHQVGDRVSIRRTVNPVAKHNGLSIGHYIFKVASVCGTKMSERIYGDRFYITALDAPDGVSKEAAPTIPIMYLSDSQLEMDIPEEFRIRVAASLVDINGRVLRTAFIEELQERVQFDISNLPAAVYLVVFETPEGLIKAYKAFVP